MFLKGLEVFRGGAKGIQLFSGSELIEGVYRGFSCLEEFRRL